MANSGKGKKGGVTQLCWNRDGCTVIITLISHDLERDLAQIAKQPADVETPRRSRRRRTTGPMNKFQLSKRQRRRKQDQ